MVCLLFISLFSSLLQFSVVQSNTFVTKTQVLTSVDKFHPSSGHPGQSQSHGQSHGQGHDLSYGSGNSQFQGKSLDRLRHAESRLESFIERMEIGVKTGILSKVLQMIKQKFDVGEINIHKFFQDFNQTYPLTLQSFITQSSDDAHFLMDKLHGRLDALGNHIKGFSLMFENNRGFIDYSSSQGHGSSHSDFSGQSGHK